MRQIQFHQIGIAEDVVSCVEVPEVNITASDDVLVAVDIFPINAADLLTLQGYYPRSSPGAVSLGIEALGTVEAVGPSVRRLNPGDRVILLSLDNWTEKKIVKAEKVIRVLPTIDPRRLACLKVNPATAALLMTRFANLRAGDWLIQNAANSAVGRAVIQIAKTRGIRTINVIRRPEVIAELKDLGADVVLCDGDDLSARVAEAAKGEPIKLALDAVAGSATDQLASCLAGGGTVVVFGAMSGEAATINPGSLVFQDIRVQGFWLTRHLASAPYSDLVRLYAELEELAGRGYFSTKTASIFPAEDIKNAVSLASSTSGNEKVFVSFRSDSSER